MIYLTSNSDSLGNFAREWCYWNIVWSNIRIFIFLHIFCVRARFFSRFFSFFAYRFDSDFFCEYSSNKIIEIRFVLDIALTRRTEWLQLNAESNIHASWFGPEPLAGILFSSTKLFFICSIIKIAKYIMRH